MSDAPEHGTERLTQPSYQCVSREGHDVAHRLDTQLLDASPGRLPHSPQIRDGLGMEVCQLCAGLDHKDAIRFGIPRGHLGEQPRGGDAD